MNPSMLFVRFAILLCGLVALVFFIRSLRKPSKRIRNPHAPLEPRRVYEQDPEDLRNQDSSESP